jgi:hypothetical protein
MSELKGTQRIHLGTFTRRAGRCATHRSQCGKDCQWELGVWSRWGGREEGSQDKLVQTRSLLSGCDGGLDFHLPTLPPFFPPKAVLGSQQQSQVERHLINSLSLNMHSLSHYQHPHHSGTFVPTGGPTLTHHCDLKSTVHTRVHSWCCIHQRFKQTSRYHCITEHFHHPTILCALAACGSFLYTFPPFRMSYGYSHAACRRPRLDSFSK